MTRRARSIAAAVAIACAVIAAAVTTVSSADRDTVDVSNAQHARPVWYAYPVRADGTVRPGRQFAEASAWVRAGERVPDGLKVDRQGNVFAAGPGGIHVFASDGARLGRIVTGVPTGNLNWGEDGSVLNVAANHRPSRP